MASPEIVSSQAPRRVLTGGWAFLGTCSCRWTVANGGELVKCNNRLRGERKRRKEKEEEKEKKKKKNMIYGGRFTWMALMF